MTTIGNLQLVRKIRNPKTMANDKDQKPGTSDKN